MQNLFAMANAESKSRTACPFCQSGQMETLTRIEHNDGSVTIYWRCPMCSHVEIKRDSDVGRPQM